MVRLENVVQAALVRELTIRGWRVRGEGPGYVVFFDPSVETVKLYAGGMEVAYEVREGREVSEAGARSTDQSRISQYQLPFAWEGG